MLLTGRPLSQRTEGTGTLSTDKIPNIAPALDEWSTALQRHPDLAHDLREARAFITLERRRRTLARRVGRLLAIGHQVAWPTISRPSDFFDDDALPVLLATTWLHKRYARLWAEAGILPPMTLQRALDAAVIAGAWSVAIPVLHSEGAYNSDKHRVIATVFDNAKQVRPPEWIAHVENSPVIQGTLRDGGSAEDLIRFRAMLLTLTPRATLGDAIEELKAAWPLVAGDLDPAIGTRPGKAPQGRPTDITQYITWYRLYRQWRAARTAAGAPQSLMAFAKAFSKRELPIQRRLLRLAEANKTPLTGRVGALVIVSPGVPDYIRKRMKEIILPITEPDTKTRPLREWLGRIAGVE